MHKRGDLGHVCFLKSSFWKTIFQTFLYLFAFIKVGQQKTFSSQWKIFQSKKNLVWFSGKCFPLAVFVFRKVVCGKLLSKLLLCLFAIRKVGQQKILSSKRKIWLGFQESVFLKNLGGKHFPEVMKNLEISLFTDYIKFDP